MMKRQIGINTNGSLLTNLYPSVAIGEARSSDVWR
jgi:hypothetical protein